MAAGAIDGVGFGSGKRKRGGSGGIKSGASVLGEEASRRCSWRGEPGYRAQQPWPGGGSLLPRSRSGMT
jgi:hypothetical protein